MSLTWRLIGNKDWKLLFIFSVILFIICKSTKESNSLTGSNSLSYEKKHAFITVRREKVFQHHRGDAIRAGASCLLIARVGLNWAACVDQRVSRGWHEAAAELDAHRTLPFAQNNRSGVSCLRVLRRTHQLDSSTWSSKREMKIFVDKFITSDFVAMTFSSWFFFREGLNRQLSGKVSIALDWHWKAVARKIGPCRPQI